MSERIDDFDEDASYEELLKKEVKSECNCGQCCRLIIEVELHDAEREPRIKELGSPLESPLDGSGKREVVGYMLNSRSDYACVFLGQDNRCSIYPTRPLVCRLFDCNGEGKEQLIELGWIDRSPDEDGEREE